MQIGNRDSSQITESVAMFLLTDLLVENISSLKTSNFLCTKCPSHTVDGHYVEHTYLQCKKKC
jgi:hypothetical protein